MIMAKKEIKFRGKTLQELQEMDRKELLKLLNSRQRRSMKRGLTPVKKKFLKNLEKAKGTDKAVKTRSRDMIILPEMVGSKIGIHNGQEYKIVEIDESMIGYYIGEFAPTRGRVKHSSPGFGATRSSKFVPLK